MCGDVEISPSAMSRVYLLGSTHSRLVLGQGIHWRCVVVRVQIVVVV